VRLALVFPAMRFVTVRVTRRREILRLGCGSTKAGQHPQPCTPARVVDRAGRPRQPRVHRVAVVAGFNSSCAAEELKRKVTDSIPPWFGQGRVGRIKAVDEPAHGVALRRRLGKLASDLRRPLARDSRVSPGRAQVVGLVLVRRDRLGCGKGEPVDAHRRAGVAGSTADARADRAAGAIVQIARPVRL